MALRKCDFCGHLWKDRVTVKRTTRDRCPSCHRSLKPTPLSRTRVNIPTAWIKKHIGRTVEELDGLSWAQENEGRRNKLQGRLEVLKIIEKTFVLPEEELLDMEEMVILNAEPEAVGTIVPLRKKE